MNQQNEAMPDEEDLITDEIDGSKDSANDSIDDTDSSDTSSDSDDDKAGVEEAEMLDTAEYENQLKPLEQGILENPCNYQLYIDIIKLTKQNVDFTRLLEYRQKMSDIFPLTEKLWLDWLKDEQKLMTSDSDREKVDKLFERALGDYMSVDVYLEYIQFSIGDMAKPDGLERIRSVCERALEIAGLDVSKGYALWEAYREFESAILSGLQASSAGSIQTEEQKSRLNEQINRIVNLFKRQLAVCLDNTESTYTEFEQFDDTYIDQEVKDTYRKSLEKYKEILPSEMALRNLEANETKKLEEYKSYLDLELKNLRFKSGVGQKKGYNNKQSEQKLDEDELQYCRRRIKCLFERAIADNQNCLDVSLWLKYIYFLNEEESNQSTLESNDFYLKVSARSVRNFPWSGKLWINYAFNLEKADFMNKTSFDTDGIRAVFNQALNSGLQTSEDYLQVWHSYLDYLKRGLLDEKTQSVNETKVEEIREAFQKAINQLFEFFKHKGDPTYSLEKYWAFVEAKYFKNMEQSRKIYNEMILAKTDAPRYAQIWLEFYELEREFGDAKHQRKLLNRALNEVIMEEKELIYELFLKFEKSDGNVQQHSNIYFRYEQFREISRVIAARKKEKIQQKEALPVQKDVLVKKSVTVGKEKAVDKSASLKRKKSDSTGDSIENNQAKKMPIKDKDGFAIPSLPFSSPTATEHVVAKTAEASNKKQPITEAKTTEQYKKFSDHTVFISNLSFNLDEAALRTVFEKEPGFAEIRLVRNWGGKCKGYGYVDFDNAEHATDALKLDRSLIDGRPLFVSKNTDKSQEVGTESKLKYAASLEKNKLFITGLPFSMEKEQLEEILEKFGKLKEVRIVTYKNGKSKGLAYAEFEDEQSASQALLKTDGMLIGENQISVAISNPPKRKDPTELRAPNEKARSLGSGSYKMAAASTAPQASNQTAGKSSAMSFVPRSQVIGRKRPTLSFK